VALARLRGGTVFSLRFALFRSAGDVVLGDLLAADVLVYAGYGAGACVLSSPGHPETAAMDLVAALYRAAGVGYRPLRDGQALLINGADTEVV
jgi:dipeptidase E